MEGMCCRKHISFLLNMENLPILFNKKTGQVGNCPELIQVFD